MVFLRFPAEKISDATGLEFARYGAGGADWETLANQESRLTLAAMKEPTPIESEQPPSKEAEEAEQAAARMDRIYRFCSKIAYVGIALWAIATIDLWMKTH